MIGHPTFEDGQFVRPYLFLSENVPDVFCDGICGIISEAGGISPDIIRLPSFDRLDFPVASHPDMLVLPAGGRSLFVYREYYGMHRCVFDGKGFEVHLTDAAPGKKYPSDILLNFLIFGDSIIGRCDMLPPELKALGLRPVTAKQGYARCSVCLADGCAITADKTLAEILTGMGADVLLLSPGGIKLDGYDYGFIGGASIVYRNEIIFFGNPATHPDGERIAVFTDRHGLKIHPLSDGELTDFGGGFVI